MMRLFVFLPVAFGLLCGCETYYRMPVGAEMAKVRFTSSAPGQSIMVTAFESEECEFGTSGGIMGVVGGISNDPLGNVPPDVRDSGNTMKMIGYDESSGIKPIEREVAANKQFVFSVKRINVISMSLIKTCDLSLTFFPVANGQYEIGYGEDESTCGLSVFKLAVDAYGEAVRTQEPTTRKTRKECSGMAGVN